MATSLKPGDLVRKIEDSLRCSVPKGINLVITGINGDKVRVTSEGQISPHSGWHPMIEFELLATRYGSSKVPLACVNRSGNAHPSGELELVPSETDPVNHPSHYKTASGVEVIDLTEQLDFNRGNAVKYLCRAGKKDGVDELQDLLKAQWYVNRAVEKLKKERG